MYECARINHQRIPIDTMNRELVRRLFLYLVDQLQDLDAPISTIRLVKYLYLIDWEHYCRHKKTLSNIDWINYKYGPYFYELPEVLKSTKLDLEIQEKFSSTKVTRTFRVYEEHKIEDLLDYGTESWIRKIITIWAYEDLEYLLDFVYTETEPMRFSKYGNKLDFSTIQCDYYMFRPRKTIKLPKENSKKIQELLKVKRKTRTESNQIEPSYDKAYYAALERMDAEERLLGDIGGNVRISKDSLDMFNEISE